MKERKETKSMDEGDNNASKNTIPQELFEINPIGYDADPDGVPLGTIVITDSGTYTDYEWSCRLHDAIHKEEWLVHLFYDVKQFIKKHGINVENYYENHDVKCGWYQLLEMRAVNAICSGEYEHWKM